MADCMRRISVSWSPAALVLWEGRQGRVEEGGDSDSGAAVGGVSAVAALARLAGGDTESSMTNFSSSESPPHGGTSSLAESESSLLCFTTGWWLAADGAAGDGSASSCELPLASSGRLSGLLLVPDGRPVTLVPAASFATAGVFTDVLSPKVSRSVRSTSKSRASSSKDTTFLWDS